MSEIDDNAKHPGLGSSPQLANDAVEYVHLTSPPENVDPVPKSGESEIKPDVEEKNPSPNPSTTIFPTTCALSPAEMTDEKRLLEVSDILAAGFIRSRMRQAKNLQNSSASSVNRLAISGIPSIDVEDLNSEVK